MMHGDTSPDTSSDPCGGGDAGGGGGAGNDGSNDGSNGKGGLPAKPNPTHVTHYMKPALQELYNRLDALQKAHTSFGWRAANIYDNLSLDVGVRVIDDALKNEFLVIFSKNVFDDMDIHTQTALEPRRMGGIFHNYYYAPSPKYFGSEIYHAAFGGLAAAASFAHPESKGKRYWEGEEEEYDAYVLEEHEGYVKVTLHVAGEAYDVFLGSLCALRVIVVHYEEEECKLFE
jgi:hypothetical protein